jgi:hypothetical protein
VIFVLKSLFDLYNFLQFIFVLKGLYSERQKYGINSLKMKQNFFQKNLKKIKRRWEMGRKKLLNIN